MIPVDQRTSKWKERQLLWGLCSCGEATALTGREPGVANNPRKGREGEEWFLILSRGILVTLAVENESEVKTHPFQLIHSMADLNPGLPISQGQWIGSFQRHEIITIRSTSHALSASTGLISPSDGLLLQLEY